MAEFCEILRRLRKRRGLTQQALAEELGVSFSTVSMYERGNRCPDMAMLGRIADFFGVSTDCLHGKGEQSAELMTADEALSRLAARYGISPGRLAELATDGSGELVLADPTGQGATTAGVSLTPHEQALLAAYRARPEVQPFVDKLLDIGE